MASADRLKALLKSHLEGDDARFFSTAMQVAAHEARRGHGKLAKELRDMIDAAKSRREAGAPAPIGRPRGELASLLEISSPKARLKEMILDKPLSERIERVIREQRHAAKILDRGLSPRRKLLPVGPPGTGKTLTASVLAGELGLSLFPVGLDGLIAKFMGETSARLRQVFDATGRTRGVYFFDEFDAIGPQRGLGNDVGEIRRVLKAFCKRSSGIVRTASSSRRPTIPRFSIRRCSAVSTTSCATPCPTGARSRICSGRAWPETPRRASDGRASPRPPKG